MKDLHKNSAKTLQWKEVTTNDMKKFLGLLVLMGQTKKTCWRDYWSTDPLVEIPIFPKTMSRMRFEQIFTFFHLSDNVENVLSTDRLYKIRPLLDYVISKSQSMYVPKQQLSLDEAMIPWRGRLKFKTYNPAKITKYGILVRMVCESESGYICNFEVYSGVGKKLEETILSILQPYFGFNHHVYQDNYYNNVSTASILLENKIRVCGTIRENRGLPKLLIEKSKNLQRRQMTFLRKGPILLLTWKDKSKGVVFTRSQCPQTNHEREEIAEFPYRNLIGCLSFLANRTKPDIGYAVNILSRYQNNPGKEHWKGLLRLLGYVK
ncbi:PiggyBac transposable element-derived protein 4, partial [Araneus ventricosus]